MEHVRAAGYPVPQVFRCGPGELELARVEGPTMLADLEAQPWRAAAHGRTLADLHARLHAIAAPDSDLLAHRRHPASGTALLHLDLHPGNVLCSPDGPVVIDWPNVMLGDPAADVCLSWILMAAFEPDPAPTLRSPLARTRRWVLDRIEPRIRRRLVSAFLATSGLEDRARALLPTVAAVRLGDRNVRPAERAAITALVERESTPAA